MIDASAGHILIVSGHPGSGKTTLAETLAHRPGTPKVHLHSDDFWGYIKTGRIEPWLPQSHAQNQMIMEIAAGVAGAYARNGYFVILDGVIRPWALAAFEALQLPLHYLVLRSTRDEAVARCLARGGDSLTDPVVVQQLWDEFADLGKHERFVLDVGGLDRNAALESVLAALGTGQHRLITRPQKT